MSETYNPAFLRALLQALSMPQQQASAPASLNAAATQGRNGDTMLAHVNPEEAALLKARGGAGTVNPRTGLPEFYDTGQSAGESGALGAAGDAAGGFGGGLGMGNAPGGGGGSLPEVNVGPGSNATGINAGLNQGAAAAGSAGFQEANPGAGALPGSGLLESLMSVIPSGIPGYAKTGAGLLAGSAALPAMGVMGIGGLINALGGQGLTPEQQAAATAQNNASPQNGGVAPGNPLYVDPALMSAILYAGG
jgi:hypothetical protein